MKKGTRCKVMKDDASSGDESLELSNDCDYSSDDFENSENISDCEDLETLLSKKDDLTLPENGAPSKPYVKKVATVMTNILSTKGKKQSSILSKTHQSLKRKRDNKEENIRHPPPKKKIPKAKLRNRGRLLPGFEDIEKERAFKILATQGVVQLFSTINKHRVELNNELKKVKGLNQQEKVLSSKGEDHFMSLLHKEGNRLKASVDVKDVKTEIKKEEEEEEDDDNEDDEYKSVYLDSESRDKKWNALAENYYKEPSLAGWDKDNDSD